VTAGIPQPTRRDRIRKLFTSANAG
jgi:hypothetical protein